MRSPTAPASSETGPSAAKSSSCGPRKKARATATGTGAKAATHGTRRPVPLGWRCGTVDLELVGDDGRRCRGSDENGAVAGAGDRWTRTGGATQPQGRRPHHDRGLDVDGGDAVDRRPVDDHPVGRPAVLDGDPAANPTATVEVLPAQRTRRRRPDRLREPVPRRRREVQRVAAPGIRPAHDDQVEHRARVGPRVTAPARRCGRDAVTDAPCSRGGIPTAPSSGTRAPAAAQARHGLAEVVGQRGAQLGDHGAAGPLDHDVDRVGSASWHVHGERDLHGATVGRPTDGAGRLSTGPAPRMRDGATSGLLCRRHRWSAEGSGHGRRRRGCRPDARGRGP